MKRETYICKSITTDGVLRSVGTIVIENGVVVSSEHKLLDSEDELRRRIDAISARCVFCKE